MIKSVLFLFAILAIASSLDVKLEKDFFFVGTNNKFKSTLYQTDTHVIVQSVEFPSNTQPVPQYLALDLTTGNATQILNEVSAACDPSSFVFDKLIYHDASSKLVYYCTNNNSVLFIDKEDYHVTNYIDIGGSTIFNETRLIPDGDNLVILGIVDFFGQEATSTQFIRVNVGRRTILNNVSLGDSLKKPQTVVAFASSQVEEYVLATQTDGQNETISLYFMLWTGSSLKLVPVTSTTYNTNGTTVIHNLYCYGSFVVTNTATDIIIVNQIGAVVYNYPNITQTKISASSKNWAWQLSYGKQYGSQDLYLLFNNDTLEHLTISGLTISSETIGTASQMMVVIGSTQQDDLLFVIGDQGPLFSVIKAATKEIVYQRPNGYRNLMITSATYAAEYSPYLFIFNSTTDALIANLTIGLYYYHDTDNGIVYFLNASNPTPNANCSLISIDLTKATYTNVYQFQNYTACTGKITAIDNTDPSSIQASILTSNSTLLVITKPYGLLTFTPPSPTSGRNLLSYSIIDFKTFNLNYIYSQDYQSFTVELYTYDAANNSFSSGLSYGFQLSSFPISNIYTISGEELIAVSRGAFAYLNVSATKPTLFSNNYNRAQMSKFNTADGNTYMIFTEDPRYNLIRSIQPPSLFDFSNLNQLPETNTETTQAGAAGSCSFWTVEGMITSVGIVKYYNACSSRTESIYA